MNSPKISAQTSAPVAALRSVLPTETNARVEAALGCVADVFREVLGLEERVFASCDYQAYEGRIKNFAAVDEAARERLRSSFRETDPDYVRLRARIAQIAAPASAARLSARLESVVEDASELAAGPAPDRKWSVAGSIPKKWDLYRLTDEQADVLGTARALDLTDTGVSNLKDEEWVRVALMVGKLRFLDLELNALCKLSAASWASLAPELGKVRSLGLMSTNLDTVLPEVWEFLAPALGNVRSLNLQGNSLRNLPAASWKKLAPWLMKVPHLNVRYNGLESLDPSVWAPLSARPKGPDFQY